MIHLNVKLVPLKIEWGFAGMHLLCFIVMLLKFQYIFIQAAHALNILCLMSGRCAGIVWFDHPSSWHELHSSSNEFRHLNDNLK